MKKEYEKNEAIRLRSQQGLSYRQISKILSVSKSTLSIWLKDVPLTDEQKQVLKENDGRTNFKNVHAKKGAISVKKKYLDLRKKYQQEGREQARNNNILHVQGCMLYWAEGAKDKNSVDFTNSDVTMMKLFLRFITECYHVPKTSIKVAINCYDDVHSKDEIERYWLAELDLPISSLRKTTINNLPKSSANSKERKLEYGVCKIIVHNTQIIQNIYGAIQEYCGFTNDKWLL